VIVGADHDRVAHAAEHARGIRHRLAAPELRSAPPSRISVPPSCRIAISNDTRVRVEFFSKIIAERVPASGASASALPLGQPVRAALRA
jgi:hypothetical protein